MTPQKPRADASSSSRRGGCGTEGQDPLAHLALCIPRDPSPPRVRLCSSQDTHGRGRRCAPGQPAPALYLEGSPFSHLSSALRALPPGPINPTPYFSQSLMGTVNSSLAGQEIQDFKKERERQRCSMKSASKSKSTQQPKPAGSLQVNMVKGPHAFCPWIYTTGPQPPSKLPAR